MTELDLDLEPEAPPPSPAVLAARQRRALVAGLGGGRERVAAGARPLPAERRLRATDTAPPAALHELEAAAMASAPGTGQAPARRSAAAAPLRLDDALVVPAGALMRGYIRCSALLLAGDIVGNVHCTAGPVVIRSGASLKGRLVANGDVYVCGTVGDSGGGAVITTRGKLTLAPGARVDGDVRSGRLDVLEGAVLHGVARAGQD